MNKYIIAALIFITFGGCTTHRKITKSQSKLLVEKNIDATSELKEVNKSVKHGEAMHTETNTVEEIQIKQPVNIELTAKFKIDSTATLRGDTALKLVDVSDKNVSVTIYQNGKNGQLTAKIKTLQSVTDIPFSEINIKKSSTTKTSKIDTTKVDSSAVVAKATYTDKSKIKVSTATVDKDIHKVNYVWLAVVVLGIIAVLYFYNKK